MIAAVAGISPTAADIGTGDDLIAAVTGAEAAG